MCPWMGGRAENSRTLEVGHKRGQCRWQRSIGGGSRTGKRTDNIMPKEKSRQLVNKPRVEFAMKEKVRARGAHAGSMANRKHGKGANTLQGEQSNVLQSVSVATSAKTMRHVLTRIRVLWRNRHGCIGCCGTSRGNKCAAHRLCAAGTGLTPWPACAPSDCLRAALLVGWGT